jgi:hypothetical protein
MHNGATSHNRSVYAAGAVAPLAFVRLGQSLRSFPRLTSAHFASPGLATQALIRAGKTSYTAGTLCAMPAKILLKDVKNNIGKNKKHAYNIKP